MSIIPTERIFLRKKLTYDSNERLQSNGHFFIEDLNYLLSRTSPLQIRPAFFWKAQCLFRGLPTIGTIDDIINRLRLEGHRRMIPELVDMEDEMRTDYERRKLLADQEAEVLARELADVEMAESEPQKSSREELPITSSEQVDESVQKLHNIQDRVQQSIEEDREKAHSDLLGESKHRDWDVTGDWHISCPRFEKDLDGPVTMNIYNEEKNGQNQMFAKFNIGKRLPESGVSRFEQKVVSDQKQVYKPTVSNNKTQKNDSTKANEDEEKSTDIDDKERNKDEISLFTSTSELFFLPDETKPFDEDSTSRMATHIKAGIFIGLTFSQFFYSIIFGEPNGTTLVGSFGDLSSKNSLGGLEPRKDDCEFTGIKIGMESTSPLGITSIWENKSAAAQEVKDLLRLWAAAD
ncbi:hypothetical protein EYC80_006777 [Monilinia laxa]|uniref:Uncharacterized protein n=1 Tax=Monilinia laxa TaxID=61186 RepID=A0A5N6JZ43_MONLA|nr:hypothetical protein EYC80_006777 [Monilinia laxa]